MSGIELTLRHPYVGLLDASALLPERLLNLNQAEVERISLDAGGRSIAVGDLFSVSTIESECVVVHGPVMSSSRWGASMSRGHLIIECDVGDDVGLSMTGGLLEICGNVGDRLGIGMRGGEVRISGNAGDRVGCPPMGQRRGMRGGLIKIDGSVGHRLGDCMRRGTIIVHGDAGDYVASRMIAGTIAICGNVGKQTGALMRRGTVWAPQIQPHNLAANFTTGQRVQMPYLALWYRWLASIDAKFSHWNPTDTYAERWLGDLSVQGLGEILSPALS